MNRPYVRLIVVAILVACCLQTSWAQSPDANRVKQDLDDVRRRIGDQRVSRQTEVARLDQIIERLQERVTRLERQLMGSNQFPAISMVEAKAVLDFAEAQLKESERQRQDGAATETQVAGHRLSLVRARAQVEFAKAAHLDRTFSLELDVLHAERRLADATTKQKQLKQLVAKGYASSKSLQLRQLEVEQAHKTLLRARTRLQFQQVLADAEDAKFPVTDE